MIIAYKQKAIYLKAIFTNYNQSRAIRVRRFASGMNSFVGIVNHPTNELKIEIITDKNRKMIDNLISYNLTSTVPVYCLSDLIEVCKKYNINISDINDISDSSGFNLIVERILNYKSHE